METNVTLLNNSELYLNNEELFLRSIPSRVKVGPLTTDALRLLVYYVTKASPYELAVETGYFTGTLQEWLDSLQANLTFKETVATYSQLSTLTGLNQGDLAFVEASGKVYPFNGVGFPTEDKGLEITGASAYQLAKKAGFVGTEEDWLASLQGSDGAAGLNGQDGVDGLDGVNGKSAYQLYVDYETANADGEPVILLEGDWLLSLKGPVGTDGITQDATTITFPGLSLADANNVNSTDTLLVVIGKLQAQILALTQRVIDLEGTPT